MEEEAEPRLSYPQPTPLGSEGRTPLKGEETTPLRDWRKQNMVGEGWAARSVPQEVRTPFQYSRYGTNGSSGRKTVSFTPKIKYGSSTLREQATYRTTVQTPIVIPSNGEDSISNSNDNNNNTKSSNLHSGLQTSRHFWTSPSTVRHPPFSSPLRRTEGSPNEANVSPPFSSYTKTNNINNINNNPSSDSNRLNMVDKERKREWATTWNRKGESFSTSSPPLHWKRRLDKELDLFPNVVKEAASSEGRHGGRESSQSPLSTVSKEVEPHSRETPARAVTSQSRGDDTDALHSLDRKDHVPHYIPRRGPSSGNYTFFLPPSHPETRRVGEEEKEESPRLPARVAVDWSRLQLHLRRRTHTTHVTVLDLTGFQFRAPSRPKNSSPHNKSVGGGERKYHDGASSSSASAGSASPALWSWLTGQILPLLVHLHELCLSNVGLHDAMMGELQRGLCGTHPRSAATHQNALEELACYLQHSPPPSTGADDNREKAVEGRLNNGLPRRRSTLPSVPIMDSGSTSVRNPNKILLSPSHNTTLSHHADYTLREGEEDKKEDGDYTQPPTDMKKKTTRSSGENGSPSDDTIQYAFFALPFLQKLDLSNNALSYKCVAHIGKILLGSAATLVQLDLSGNAIGEYGFRSLGVYLSKLNAISVRENPSLFTHALSLALAEEKSKKKKKKEDSPCRIGPSSLLLSGCQSSIRGISTLLCGAAKARDLIHINLSNNYSHPAAATGTSSDTAISSSSSSLLEWKLSLLSQPPFSNFEDWENTTETNQKRKKGDHVDGKGHSPTHPKGEKSSASRPREGFSYIYLHKVPLGLQCSPAGIREMLLHFFYYCPRLTELNLSSIVDESVIRYCRQRERGTASPAPLRWQREGLSSESELGREEEELIQRGLQEKTLQLQSSETTAAPSQTLQKDSTVFSAWQLFLEEEGEVEFRLWNGYWVYSQARGGDILCELLAHISFHHRVKRLFESGPVPSFQLLPSLCHLQSLLLSRSGLTDCGVRGLCIALKINHQSEPVRSSSNVSGFEEGGQSAESPSYLFQQLEVLDVSDNYLSEVGCVSLINAFIINWNLADGSHGNRSSLQCLALQGNRGCQREARENPQRGVVAEAVELALRKRSHETNPKSLQIYFGDYFREGTEGASREKEVTVLCGSFEEPGREKKCSEEKGSTDSSVPVENPNPGLHPPELSSIYFTTLGNSPPPPADGYPIHHASVLHRSLDPGLEEKEKEGNSRRSLFKELEGEAPPLGELPPQESEEKEEESATTHTPAPEAETVTPDRRTNWMVDVKLLETNNRFGPGDDNNTNNDTSQKRRERTASPNPLEENGGEEDGGGGRDLHKPPLTSPPLNSTIMSEPSAIEKEAEEKEKPIEVEKPIQSGGVNKRVIKRRKVKPFVLTYTHPEGHLFCHFFHLLLLPSSSSASPGDEEPVVQLRSALEHDLLVLLRSKINPTSLPSDNDTNTNNNNNNNNLDSPTEENTNTSFNNTMTATTTVDSVKILSVGSEEGERDEEPRTQVDPTSHHNSIKLEITTNEKRAHIADIITSELHSDFTVQLSLFPSTLLYLKKHFSQKGREWDAVTVLEERRDKNGAVEQFLTDRYDGNTETAVHRNHRTWSELLNTLDSLGRPPPGPSADPPNQNYSAPNNIEVSPMSSDAAGSGVKPKHFEQNASSEEEIRLNLSDFSDDDGMIKPKASRDTNNHVNNNNTTNDNNNNSNRERKRFDDIDTDDLSLSLSRSKENSSPPSVRNFTPLNDHKKPENRQSSLDSEAVEPTPQKIASLDDIVKQFPPPPDITEDESSAPRKSFLLTLPHQEGSVLCRGWSALQLPPAFQKNTASPIRHSLNQKRFSNPQNPISPEEEISLIEAAREFMEMDLQDYLQGGSDGGSRHKVYRVTLPQEIGVSNLLQLSVETSERRALLSAKLLKLSTTEETEVTPKDGKKDPQVFKRFEAFLRLYPRYDLQYVLTNYFQRRRSEGPNGARDILKNYDNSVDHFIHFYHGTMAAMLKELQVPTKVQLLRLAGVLGEAEEIEKGNSSVVASNPVELPNRSAADTTTTTTTKNVPQTAERHIAEERDTTSESSVQLLEESKEMFNSLLSHSLSTAPATPSSAVKKGNLLAKFGNDANKKEEIVDVEEEIASPTAPPLVPHTAVRGGPPNVPNPAVATKGEWEVLLDKKHRGLLRIAYEGLARGALPLDPTRRAKVVLGRGKWGDQRVLLTLEWEVMFILYFEKKKGSRKDDEREENENRNNKVSENLNRRQMLVHPIAFGFRCAAGDMDVDLDDDSSSSATASHHNPNSRTKRNTPFMCGPTHTTKKGSSKELVLHLQRPYSPEELNISVVDIEERLMKHMMLTATAKKERKR